MRKIVFVALIMVSTSIAVMSQGASVGLRAGMNLANVNYEAGSVTYEPDMKAGILAGLYVKAMFTDKIGIQPEAYLSLQGFKLDLGTFGTLNQKLTYVNIPILLRYNLIKFVNIHAGPQFGLLMSAKSKLGDVTTDVKDQLKSSDLNIAFGAGLDLPMGLSGGIRYNLGLSDISNDPSSVVSTVKNKAFQVYIGYKLFGKD